MTKEILFKRDGYTYRIPALIYLKKKDQSKALLAFAEQRTNSNDETAENLVMSKGKVKGNSSKKTVEWSALEVVKEAYKDKHRTMNPCPVYDEANEKLFLFFICVEDRVTEQWQKDNYQNKARLCYITSMDFGGTWSGVIDLTDKLTQIKSWATFAVGPGHGIQTEGGRLIVPVYAYSSCPKTCLLCCCCGFCVSCLVWCFCCHHKPDQYALSLYSDDSGENWAFGKMFETKSGECEMAEISENRIYCNARSTNDFRVETFSDDNGVNFSQDQSAQKLDETKLYSGCQGSVISFPAQEQSTNAERDPNPNKWLLFTHPTNKSSRIDLGVYLNKSPSDPNAWSKHWVINAGPSGYSDLAYIDDGWFVCLYERGEKETHEQIAFEIFSYNDIKKKFQCKHTLPLHNFFLSSSESLASQNETSK